MRNVNSGMSIMLLYFCSRNDNTDVMYINLYANVSSKDAGNSIKCEEKNISLK